MTVDAEESEHAHGGTPGTGACVDSPPLGGVCACTPVPGCPVVRAVPAGRGCSGQAHSPSSEGRRVEAAVAYLSQGTCMSGLLMPCCVCEKSVNFLQHGLGSFSSRTLVVFRAFPHGGG